MATPTFDLESLTDPAITKIIQILKNGGVGVFPTDTIYGVVGSALNQQTVERIYTLRKRTPSKPMIILISSVEDLKLFNIKIDANTKQTLEKLWPNPVSVILECLEPKFEYLHRGSSSLAFRIPDYSFLLSVLQKTGPLVAPSANFEGESPAKTITDAKKYFQDQVDFYVDIGTLDSKPSTLIKLSDDQIEVLRAGLYKMDQNQV